ncbi:hypothetical protein EE612_033548, partial [Oryza sativa]
SSDCFLIFFLCSCANWSNCCRHHLFGEFCCYYRPVACSFHMDILLCSESGAYWTSFEDPCCDTAAIAFAPVASTCYFWEPSGWYRIWSFHSTNGNFRGCG